MPCSAVRKGLKTHLILSPVIVLNHSNTVFISSQVIIDELKIRLKDRRRSTRCKHNRRCHSS